MPRAHCQATKGHLFVPRGHLFMPRGHCQATKGHLFVPRGHLFMPQGHFQSSFCTPTKLNHLISPTFFFKKKMLKDNKFDYDYEFDESGIVCLEGILLAFIILYYFLL